MYREYQDKYGFIHLHKNPDIFDSENGSLFTAATYLLMALNQTPTLDMQRPMYPLLKLNEVTYVTHPTTYQARFSHDNMTGMYIAKELNIHSEKLPISRWDSKKQSDPVMRKYWKHPRDLIFYSMLQGNLFGYILAPLLLFMSIFSLIEPANITSGKCLWFYRFGILTLSENPYKRFIGSFGLLMAEKLLKKEHGDKPFISVFGYYFKDKNHPINIEIEKYYNN